MKEIERLQENRDMMETNDEFYKNCRAFIHLLNAKPDSETRIFNSGKRIYESDIRSLDEQINEKLSKHLIEGMENRVYVSLEKKGAIQFNSFEEFKNYKWQNNTNEVRTVVLEKDFYLKLDKYKFPQRHILKIRFGSTLRPHEVISLLFQKDSNDHEIETEIADVVCKIDFVDHVVSKELFQIVTDWYSLVGEERKKKDFLLFLQKNRNVVCLLSYILILVAIWSSFYLGATFYINKYMQVLKIDKILLLSILGIVLTLISNLVSKQVTSSVYQKLTDESNEKIIVLTEKDKQVLKKVKEKHKKRFRDLIIKGSLCFGYDMLLVYIGWYLTK